jgi:hypothetical protein
LYFIMQSMAAVLLRIQHRNQQLEFHSDRLLGNQMMRARDAADYEATVPRIGEMMAQQLTDADQFVAVLAQVPSTSPQLLPKNPPKTCQNCGALIS